MSSIALMPVEEYLRYSEKPNAEYRDGVLCPKAMPTKLHSMVQLFLILALRQQGLEALGELTVRSSDRKYLVPDVAADEAIQGPYLTKPVLLCCEILSPEDRLGAMLAKCEEYHAWGVPYCWVIDPVKQTAWEYNANAEPARVDPSGSLTAGSYMVNLRELFASLQQ